MQYSSIQQKAKQREPIQLTVSNYSHLSLLALIELEDDDKSPHPNQLLNMFWLSCDHAANKRKKKSSLSLSKPQYQPYSCFVLES